MPLRIAAILLIGLLTPGSGAEQAPSTKETSKETSSKTWVGRHHEIEEYLRKAECENIEVFTSTNITRCTFRPGGPVARMAWKVLPPGVYQGFKQSYKTEIAAYELDKLLKMDMVPPTVERTFQGHVGRAQQWVEKVVDARDVTSPDNRQRSHWEDQAVRMIMFDNLIGNRDRNRANMLRDPAWNLILLDHSRAFAPGRELLHKLIRIDEAYWATIEALTRSQLDAALAQWLDDNEIQAILDRREAMRAEIKLLRR
jgi:hypothetical protein